MAAQIDYGVSDIARYLAALHDDKEAAANWSSRLLIRISLTDAVGTQYSSAGTESIEELVAADLRAAGYRTDGGGEGVTLQVEIQQYDPGSRMKRIFGLPGMGSAVLEWRATLVDVSGRTLGDTKGKKRYTGYELLDMPTFKSDDELRDAMARHCAEQLGEYVGSLLGASR